MWGAARRGLRTLVALALVLATGPVESAERRPHRVTIPVALHTRAVAIARTSDRLDPAVLAVALQAFSWARTNSEVSRNVLTVIDYRLPAVSKRLWVIDLHRDAVVFHEHVAHGRNSGNTRARAFSNVSGSVMSSLGAFRTAETYTGRHGYSLRLDGLEVGLNDRARERAIVVHGAPYVGAAYARRHGRVGRSWGCPAVGLAVSTPLIDTIKNGSILFAFYPDADFLRSAMYIQSARERRATSR